MISVTEFKNDYSTCIYRICFQHRQTDTRLTAFFSRTTWVSRHQKGKPFWILLEQEILGWQWHQLDHMQITCILLQTNNHGSTSPINFMSRMLFLTTNQQCWGTEGNNGFSTQFYCEKNLCSLSFLLSLCLCTSLPASNWAHPAYILTFHFHVFLSHYHFSNVCFYGRLME